MVCRKDVEVEVEPHRCLRLTWPARIEHLAVEADQIIDAAAELESRSPASAPSPSGSMAMVDLSERACPAEIPVQCARRTCCF